jgi:hypothetical protein
MMIFLCEFSPSKDKYGFSFMTLKDYEYSSDKGEQINLKFNVMGLVKGTSECISLRLEKNYERDNRLDKTLKGMGFKLEAGMDVEERISQFLTKCKEDYHVYRAKVYKTTKDESGGAWEIDLESLKLFL